MGIYLSADQNIKTSDFLVGTRWVAKLDPGVPDTADTSITVPSSLPLGNYYIGAIADYANNATESDASNNALAGNQTAVVGPDLTMSALSAPSSAVTGRAITVNNTVLATGTSAGGFYVSIYLSSDSQSSTADSCCPAGG